MVINHKVRLKVNQIFLILIMTTMLNGLQAKIADISIESQQLGRQFGIVTGDTIKHIYVINVPDDYQLVENTVPQPGPLNYWLDFVSSEYEVTPVDDGYRRYALTLKYQIFYAPLDVRLLIIPPVVLAFNHAEEQLEITIPESSFSVSPLKSIAPLDSNEGFEMMPDVAPSTIDTDGLVMRIVISVIALVLLAIVWLIANGLLFKRLRSPFLDAYRQVKHISRNKEPSIRDFHQALLAIHHAFDITAKHKLFSHQIEGFIKRFPEYGLQKQKIEGFYSYSSIAIYHPSERITFDFDMLMTLCKSMAKSESLVVRD